MLRKRGICEEITLSANEQMVYDYFHLISKGEAQGLLELFADDAAVYEPFSNVREGLQGKSAIEHFLKVAVMANAGMHRTIEFIDKKSSSSSGSRIK
ncbi:MAG: nuclear transport factor 2 family protein [Ignavibacteriales bacterium]